MAGSTIHPNRGAQQIRALLAQPEMAGLVADLQATRWTGRRGYPVRTMVGMVLVKSLYVLPTWTRAVALVAEHDALQAAVGCAGDVPSIDACYRFTRKLRQHKGLLDACIAAVIVSLKEQMPGFGEHIAIDGSDLPAYANGQRYVSKGGKLRERFSDPDATWGHRSAISTRKGGGFYGFKIHAAVCTTTGLPVAWETHTAKDAEVPVVPTLLDFVWANGIAVSTLAMDKGYDASALYDECEARGIRPIVPLRETPFVKQGKAAPPKCDHGVWTFAGSDAKRGVAKYRCPTGECSPASVWIKADRLHTLIPRESKRWKDLYCGRAAVEREFGTLKHRWALLPLRTRTLARVSLHVDLTILARLASALADSRAVPLAA
jgi:hypothetical protein